jgi:hypothetical protein
MSAPDPLAPGGAPEAAAVPLEAAEAAPAPTTTEATPQPPPEPKRRGGCLKIVLLGAMLLVVLGGAAGGAWWWLNQNQAAGPAAAAASSPQAPVPDGPPPAVQFALAPPASPNAAAADSPLAGRIERLAGLVSAYETELASAPVAGVATSDLIVPASGRQTADSAVEVPRHERWEIQFPPGNTIESYTRQLEYFKIEIGLIGGSDQIEYLANIAEPIPSVRKAPASAEKRLYLIWQRGSMREADEQLATRARVSTAGKIVAHFCSEELEKELAQTEDSFAQQKGIKRIRKTIFGMKANDFGGFQLYVIDQKADG